MSTRPTPVRLSPADAVHQRLAVLEIAIAGALRDIEGAQGPASERGWGLQIAFDDLEGAVMAHMYPGKNEVAADHETR